MADIRSWLEQQGLGKYAETFVENDVDFRTLPALTEADLKELGLTLGHRRILQKVVGELGQNVASKDLPSAAVPATTVASTGEAERRQLTVMFCDLVGSVELGERMDVEDYRDLLTRFRTAAVGARARSREMYWFVGRLTAPPPLTVD